MTPTGKLAHAQNTVKRIRAHRCLIAPGQYNTSYHDIYVPGETLVEATVQSINAEQKRPRSLLVTFSVSFVSSVLNAFGPAFAGRRPAEMSVI